MELKLFWVKLPLYPTKPPKYFEPGTLLLEPSKAGYRLQQKKVYKMKGRECGFS
jgi:hypothetical protein